MTSSFSRRGLRLRTTLFLNFSIISENLQYILPLDTPITLDD